MGSSRCRCQPRPQSFLPFPSLVMSQNAKTCAKSSFSSLGITRRFSLRSSVSDPATHTARISSLIVRAITYLFLLTLTLSDQHISLYHTHPDRSLSHARSSYANLTVVGIVTIFSRSSPPAQCMLIPKMCFGWPLPAVPSRAAPRDMTEN